VHQKFPYHQKIQCFLMGLERQERQIVQQYLWDLMSPVNQYYHQYLLGLADLFDQRNQYHQEHQANPLNP